MSLCLLLLSFFLSSSSYSLIHTRLFFVASSSYYYYSALDLFLPVVVDAGLLLGAVSSTTSMAQRNRPTCSMT